MQVRALILRAPGINRDRDAALACELAGASPERIHINQLAEGSVRLADYGMVLIPGGFSYGDHLGAGRLLAIDLVHRLGEALYRFVEDGRPVIGICNGFQVLVKAGLLPGCLAEPDCAPAVTLTDNASEQFECRWVTLEANPGTRCSFVRDLTCPIEVPVAHGEGRIALRDEATLALLEAQGLIALRYTTAMGDQAISYPANPNGSVGHIAGLCNAQGNVLGLMPHPENAILPQQHPRWTREEARDEGDGLLLFRNAVRYAAAL
ncbi:phosphoribosylformylglycinamidine synthase I [Candidatus Chloroploca sp. Khr17]|uniref:phosphoribosylformylglycinamidine synthase I n=1 Tax=Candidatus Chloroploca sp. Khr17 TaxID=2496869 RepID=UPI00101C10AA|nr:phosphoribosylformylglycinamidine synthase I [Candidatus Chloroploca sp. Khr17]